MRTPTVLTRDEATTLEACSHYARHPRQRRRAQAVLGHHRGQTLTQLASFFAVRYATHGWLSAWCDHGLAGLLEGHRTGRPPKLPPAAKKSNHLARPGYPATKSLDSAPASRLWPEAAHQHVATNGGLG